MTVQSKIEPSLVSALAKALPELESAKKNKANPAFKSKYADLAAMIEAIEPIAKHGLWFRQVAIDNPDGAMVETFYIHESGEQLSAGTTFTPATKKDAQGFGSALTYCRRYALQTAFGLAVEDDDGNAAAKSQRNHSAAPADAHPISDADWAKLVQLCQATGATSAQVKSHIGAANLKVLTVAQYDAAVNYLENKLAEAAKAETDAMAKEPA